MSAEVLTPTSETESWDEPAPSAPAGIDLRLIAITLLRRLPLTLLVLMICSGAGLWAASGVKPRYEARAILLRHNKNNSVNPDIYFEPSLRTVLETVKLRQNLEGLRRRLKLTLSDEELFAAIDVRPGNRSDILHILASADDPKLAAGIANGISEIFQQSSSGLSRAVAERVWRFRSAQRQALLKELGLAQNKLEAFQRKHQISFFEDTTRLMLEQIKQLELDQNNARIQLQKDRLRMSAISSELAQRPENVRVTSTVRHRTRVRLGELQSELKALLERYTEANPKVISLRRQIDAVETQLNAEAQLPPEEESFGMDPVVRELKIKQAEINAGLSGGQSQVESLGTTIQSHHARLNKLSGLEKDFGRLKRDIDRISENLRENDYRLAEAENARRSEISSFDVVERATAPADSLPTGRKLLAVAGLAAGLLLGLLLPLGVELADLRLKSPLQFQGLGLRFLGLLPQRTRRSQLVYSQLWLLFINRLLLSLEGLPGPRLLLISSDRSGEGKHFVCEQLLDILRFRGEQIVHIRPDALVPDTSPAANDLSEWLQLRDALLPFPQRSDSQTQTYSYHLDDPVLQRPLLRDKLPELLARHSQAGYILWELPPLNEHLPWLLMLSPAASAMLLVARFRGSWTPSLRARLAELRSLQPDLPLFGILNQVPWAYRQLRGKP